MKIYIAFLGVLAVSSVTGRSVTNEQSSYGDASRTLKGVLKYYRDQPRVTDSESLEFDDTINNADSYRLDIEVGKEKGDLLPVKISKVPGKKVTKYVEKKVVEAVASSLEQEGTTVVPSEKLDDPEPLSKSDLYSDDIEELDECLEGDVTKISCNTCVCSDKKYFCSKRDCNDPQRPLPPRQTASSKRKGVIKYHSVKGDEQSETKTEAISETNSVGNVSNSGVEFSSALLAQCIDGRTKPVDCNQCVCAQGKWACTKMSCIALTLREKASFSGGEFLKSAGTLKEYMNIDEDCMEGEAKQVGCNQCVCHHNSWACSDFKCPSTPKPIKVEPIEESCQTEEDVKSKDCNICSCRRGVWVCTKNDCKKFGDRYFNPVSQKHNSNSNDNDQDK